MGSGLHHVTLVTRRAQDNLDFYAGVLGLRLVKRSAGFEDTAQLHLFYGDAFGRPGSLVTFLAWEDGAPGRPGLGQATEIGLVVPPTSIGFWLTRAMATGTRFEGPAVIVQDDTTTWAPAGFAGEVDGYGNLILRRRRQA